MRLLIADLVRRHRWKTAVFSVLFLVMFGASAAIGDSTRAFGVSMGMALSLGPQMTLWYVPRPIWYLPVAKRDIWRAGWLVTTVGVTLLTTAVKLAAMLVPSVRDSFGLANVVLSSAYDFAIAGAGCGLVILATRPEPTSGPWRPVAALFKGLAQVVLPSGLLLGMYGSGAIRNVLPTHWADLTAWSAAALVAALGLTAATYFHSPLPLTPTNRIHRPARVKTGTPRVELGGLSGLPRLLAHESAWTLMVGGLMVVGSLLFVFVAARFVQSQESLSEFLPSLLLRLDGTVTPAPGRGLDAFIPVIGFAVFIASLVARFPAMLRHLRILPLGAARLNALLIAGPAVTWLVAWTGLLALHYVVVGRGVASYHAAALLGLIGLSAIVQALTLRLSEVLRILLFAMSIGVVPVLMFLDVPSPKGLAAGGAALLAVAVVLNHRSLARKSTYTPIGPVIAVAPLQR